MLRKLVLTLVVVMACIAIGPTAASSKGAPVVHKSRPMTCQESAPITAPAPSPTACASVESAPAAADRASSRWCVRPNAERLKIPPRGFVAGIDLERLLEVRDGFVAITLESVSYPSVGIAV